MSKKGSKPKESIKIKLIASLFIAVVITAAMSSYFSYTGSRSVLSNQIMTDLVMLSEAKEGHIMEFLEGAKKRVIDFSSDGFIRDSVFKINESQDAFVVKELSNYLVKNKKSLDSAILGINIINKDGEVIASTDVNEIGRRKGFVKNEKNKIAIAEYLEKHKGSGKYEEWGGVIGDEYYVGALKLGYGEVFLGDVSRTHHFGYKDVVFPVSAPLISKHTSEAIGVIVSYIHIKDLNSVVNGVRQDNFEKTDSSNLLNNGKTNIYLVNEQRLLITQPRNSLDGAILNQKVDTNEVRDCILKKQGHRGEYVNYKGDVVVGAVNCLKNNNWILVTEVNKQIALRGIEKIKQDVLIATLFILFFVFLVAYALIRRIVDPLEELVKAVTKIKKGSYNLNLKVRTNDELGELVEAFNGLAQVIRSRAQEKNVFITSASHQFRTPISKVQLELELLKRAIQTNKTKKEILLLVKQADDSNSKTRDIINDLFKILELGDEYEAARLVKIDVNELILSVIQSFSQKIKKKRINMLVEIPRKLSICANLSNIKIVFLKLLDNAITYSKRGGKIEIKARKVDGQILFQVIDFGIGIPEAEQINVFDKFFRAKNAYSVKNVGSGLSLSIVKNIIEGHKGRIMFESRTNKGTTFYFSLPQK